ncbi:MAG: sulfate adenylyltransferase subunit CysN [Cohaesibacter sp.]|jgi:bifunctional enzyme CysN/CysC|nr:sulfate adenylyltransferase subunit CysN [Cohaesibacter sp.]
MNQAVSLSSAIATDNAPSALSNYLAAQQEKSFLRFITCGSVDDGKSTLIGRLLYDTKLIFEDQLSALEHDSKRHGTVGEDIDFALLLDGLQAEREQGITIDVAYRFFATDKRKFIVADTPGHEQYTRNMATGASNCDLAVILVDARHGIVTQTRRHSFINSLIGVRHVVLAVNKIDLVDYDQAAFDKIVEDYKQFASGFDFDSITAIPLSARFGDNVVERGPNLSWYEGPSLLGHLESIEITKDEQARPFRFPVQWVNRPNLDFRGFSGTLTSGRVRVGDEIVVAKSGKSSRIKEIVTFDGTIEDAVAGEAVTLTLEDEIDISRGDILTQPDHRPHISNQIAAHLIWMDDAALLAGRSYILKIGAQEVTASVTAIKHKVDVNSFAHEATTKLGLNEIGFCNLSTSQPIVFDKYEENRETGSFILIDRFSNQTVAAGLVWFGLNRADNVHWQAMDIDKAVRSEQKHQKPKVLWFTGLSGSGKSTIANLVEKKLHAVGKHTYVLDGDNIRHGLNKDLGFSDEDRVENIRRIGEVAKLMTDAGLIVLVSFISPFRAERDMVRSMLDDGEFAEIFVDTPLETCEARDPKGLYQKARQGEIANFTGISSPYEAPEAPDVHIKTGDHSAEDAALKIIRQVLGDDGIDPDLADFTI